MEIISEKRGGGICNTNFVCVFEFYILKICADNLLLQLLWQLLSLLVPAKRFGTARVPLGFASLLTQTFRSKCGFSRLNNAMALFLVQTKFSLWIIFRITVFGIFVQEIKNKVIEFSMRDRISWKLEGLLVKVPFDPQPNV